MDTVAASELAGSIYQYLRLISGTHTVILIISYILWDDFAKKDEDDFAKRESSI